MSNRSPARIGALARLPRGWWFPTLTGLRGRAEATYERFELDTQPHPVAADDELSWLEDDSEKAEWTIETGDPGQQVRPLSVDDLVEVAPGHHLPRALLRLAGRRQLQRRIRSATGCYLDLGNHAVRTTAEGSVLIHLLSDQQWCRHWLLYADDAGHEAVLTSTEPIGFELPDDWSEEPGEVKVPGVIPLDGTLDLEVCADSFTEFLYRFWVENELHFALADARPLTGRLAAYAEQLRAAG